MPELFMCIVSVLLGFVAARLVFGKKIVLQDREVIVEVARPCTRECCTPFAGDPLPPPPIADVLADVYDDDQLRAARVAYESLTPEGARILPPGSSLDGASYAGACSEHYGCELFRTTTGSLLHDPLDQRPASRKGER
jgi:hypothetical protein